MEDKSLGISNAAHEGKLYIVQQLIKEKPTALNAVDDDDRTPLHWAAAGGHDDIVDFLLGQGAKVDAADDSGWTPLLIAVSAGHKSTARILIEHNADINRANDSGQTAIHYAASKNRIEIAKLLVEKGVDVNATNDIKQTALHRAATLGYTAMADILIQAHARVNPKDRVANTPLHLACEEGHGETALLLIENNVTDKEPAQLMFAPLKNDLILRAARGEQVERTPVWIMRQAGRTLPKFREMKKEHDFFTICRTPEIASEVTLEPIEYYDGLLDAAIIFSDILVIPQAMGLEVLMNPAPFFPHPIETPDDLERLTKNVDVNKELGYVFEAITLTRHKLEGRVPLFGFSGAPWTLFAYMIEGGGSKLFTKAKTWLYRYPEASHRLLQHITDVTVEYLVGQVKAGAQILQVFDSWAGDLSPEDFRTFSLPYLHQIAARVQENLSIAGVDIVPMVIFAKGAWFALKDLSNMGYSVVGLDWTIPPEFAKEQTGGRVAVQGNMDPTVLFGTPEKVRETATNMVKAFGKDAKWIANLGHGIMPGTDPEMCRVYLQTIRDVSRQIRQ
ncbi:hypothetical protein BZG36_03284 [Bifiguratus adelaidae]|uniref:Uroporphyrinogen decarboxylase n=1 Tax=Bifiguratus adelaidae TaxID=1938954 RepID=A0A261XZY5_9FUNG|nr:hypothetical protein BZG36_03284 [Bifiguratus adelaidae]